MVQAEDDFVTKNRCNVAVNHHPRLKEIMRQPTHLWGSSSAPLTALFAKSGITATYYRFHNEVRRRLFDRSQKQQAHF
jgi:hypothetical protein